MNLLRGRALGGIACGLTVGLIPHLLGASWTFLLVVVIAATVTAWIVNSPFSLLLSLPSGLAGGSVVVLSLQRFLGTFQIDATVFVLLIFVLVAVVLYLTRFLVDTGSRAGSEHLDLSVSLLLVVLTLGVLNRVARSWDVSQGFGILASNGEDNAAWLVALSHSVNEGQTVLTERSGTAGGPGTGAFIAVWREVMNWIHPGNATVSADNGLVLVRFYPLIATLCALVAVTVSLVVLRKVDQWSRLAGVLIASVASYSMVMGFATVGHFSAAVAVLFLSTAVAWSVVSTGTQRLGGSGADLVVGLCLFAAGQAWFPLSLLFAIFVTLRVGRVMWMRLRQSRGARQQAWSFAVILGVGLGVLGAVHLLFPGSAANFVDLEYIKKNLTLAGGYSTVNPWISLVAVAGSIGLVAPNWGTNEERRRSSTVVAVGVPPVLLFVWSYFLAPYSPQYGAIKYLYMTVAALLPLAVAAIIQQGWAVRSRGGALVCVCFSAGMLALFTPPLTYASWSSTVGATRYDWVNPIVRELRADPDRPVGCLNTLKDDQTQNYIAYLCSRMAFGLGGFDEVHHRVWTAANLCAAPPEQVTSEWPEERQRNLTLILFDGTRSTSSSGCQTGEEPFPRGWLTNVDLGLTRTLDIRGKPAAPRG